MRDNILAMALLSLAIIIGSAIFSKAIYDFKLSNRYVTVKGIAERTVTADLAVWTLTIAVSGDNLTEMQQKLEADQAKINHFFTDRGFNTSEVTYTPQRLMDKFSNPYVQINQQDMQLRYVMMLDVIIKTPDIKKVAETSKAIGELLKEGVALVSMDDYNRDTSPRYLFTKLNDIKPDMLSEATQEASKAGEQFAMNSKSRLGKIYTANQGVFTISSPVSTQNNGYETARMQNPDLYIEKTVRVVITAQYYLEG